MAFGEEIAGPGAAGMDLLAAVVVGSLALAALVLAYLLPNPGKPLTAPGLFPILIAGSLFVMALGLGFSAWRAGGVKELGRIRQELAPGAEGEQKGWRTALLMVTIAVYVVLLDWISFDWRFPLGGLEFQLSSYEVVSIPFLTLILKQFWRAPLWRCLLVAALAVFALAWTFRYGFRILLPGSG